MGQDTSKRNEQPEYEDEHVRCTYCKDIERVTSMTQLQRGMHICKGGANSLKHKQQAGIQKSIYSHHALVKEVVEHTEFKATVLLIHFCSAKFQNKIKIRETTETFYLKYDELYIVDYKHARFEPDEAVRRAEHALEQQKCAKRDAKRTLEPKEQNGHKPVVNKEPLSEIKYKVFAFNCEHFVSWCIIGAKVSFQVLNIRNLVVKFDTFLMRSAGIVVPIILKFAFWSSDDISHITAVYAAIFLAAILSASGLAYMLYVAYVLKGLRKKRKDNEICHKSFDNEVLDLYTEYGAFVLVLILSFLTVHFFLHLLSFRFQILIMILLIFLSELGIWHVRKVSKTLRSPYCGPKNKIESLAEIKTGDIVLVNGHSVVVVELLKTLTTVAAANATQNKTCVRSGRIKESVTNKDGTTTRSRSKISTTPTNSRDEGKRNIVSKAKIIVVHCRSCRLFGSQVITEESIIVDLSTQNVYLLSYSGYSTFKPDDVVKRAKQRIGEAKWGPLSNRSCHFCHWAKVRPGPKTASEGLFVNPIVTRAISQPVSQLNDDVIGALENSFENDNTAEFTSELTELESDCHIQSSVLIGQFDARIPSEISKGDAVLVNKNLGICVEIGSKGQKVTLNIVYLDSNPFKFTIRQQSIDVDLLKQSITILKFHPVHCRDIGMRVMIAKEMVGQKTKHWRQEAFVRDCLILEDLHPGDVVEARFISQWKRGVCIRVSKISGAFKFTMDLVYIGNAVIEQMSINVDLMKMDLWIHRYKSLEYCRNSADVVKKAKSLIGTESKSWTEDGFIRTCLLNEQLFVRRGDVVFFKQGPRNYKGICVHVCVSSNNEHVLKLVMVYKSKLHMHIKRSIFSADLRKDSLQVFKIEPKHCVREETVIRRALKRTQKIWHSSKLNFIKSCIAKRQLDSSDVFMHDKLLRWHKPCVKCTGYAEE